MSKKRKLIALAALAVVAGILFALKLHLTARAEQAVGEWAAAAEPFADVSYEDVSVELFGLNMRVRDLTLAATNGDTHPISIGELVIRDFDWTNQPPHYLSLHLVDADIPAQMTLYPMGAGFIRSIGYERLHGSLSFSYKHDPEQRTLKLKANGTFRELGDIALVVELGDFNRTSVALALVQDVPPFSLRYAELKFEDKSLVGHILHAEAERQGKESGQLRREELQEIEQARREALDQDFQRAAAFLKSWAHFLREPNEFTLTMRPSEPVPFRDVLDTGNAEALVKLLNIELQTH